jgi:hypothetical protein
MSQIPHITAAPAAKTGIPAHTPFRYVVFGSFAPNGSSALDATAIKGDLALFTVAYISTGLYRVTLQYNVNGVDNVTTGFQLAAAAAQSLQVGPVDETNRTIDLRVVNSSTGAVADVAADANNRISFTIALRGNTRKRF